jgi:hypothetical protein
VAATAAGNRSLFTTLLVKQNTLFSSNDRKTVLEFPLASLRTEYPGRLLANPHTAVTASRSSPGADIAAGPGERNRADSNLRDDEDLVIPREIGAVVDRAQLVIRDAVHRFLGITLREVGHLRAHRGFGNEVAVALLVVEEERPLEEAVAGVRRVRPEHDGAVERRRFDLGP